MYIIRLLYILTATGATTAGGSRKKERKKNPVVLTLTSSRVTQTGWLVYLYLCTPPERGTIERYDKSGVQNREYCCRWVDNTHWGGVLYIYIIRQGGRARS